MVTRQLLAAADLPNVLCQGYMLMKVAGVSPNSILRTRMSSLQQESPFCLLLDISMHTAVGWAIGWQIAWELRTC